MAVAVAAVAVYAYDEAYEVTASGAYDEVEVGTAGCVEVGTGNGCVEVGIGVEVG